jgi:oxygen-dependent protoporphyrinogen oxidase
MLAANGVTGAGAACIVVGAGPAGLAAAHRLRSHGRAVVVLEAEERVGGRTRSIRHAGSTLNTGAAFLASFYDETLALCRELGVALIEPAIHPSRGRRKRHIVTPRGRLEFGPSDPVAFLRFPAVPLAQKLRVLRTVGRLAVGPELHIAEPATLAARDHESAATWARRTLGDEATDYLIRPAIEPFFYVRAEEVSAAIAQALLRHAIRWRLWTPRDGMSALCEALAASVDVRTGTRATRVSPEGNGLVVETTAGPLRASAVVLAGQTVDMLKLGAPLAPTDRADLAAVDYEANIVVFLGYSRPVDLPVPSLTVGGPGVHALVGLTALRDGGPPGFVAAGTEIVAVLAMGLRSRELMSADDAEVVRAVLADVASLGPRLPAPEWTLLFRRPHATVVPRPGLLRRLARARARTRHGIHLAGDWLAGSSTIEGAVRSGHLAAEAVLRER